MKTCEKIRKINCQFDYSLKLVSFLADKVLI